MVANGWRGKVTRYSRTQFDRKTYQCCEGERQTRETLKIIKQREKKKEKTCKYPNTARLDIKNVKRAKIIAQTGISNLGSSVFVSESTTTS